TAGIASILFIHLIAEILRPILAQLTNENIVTIAKNIATVIIVVYLMFKIIQKNMNCIEEILSPKEEKTKKE
ncbi:MAG: hypothetical protein ACK4M3_04065, partial [Pyrobaculum sp.]